MFVLYEWIWKNAPCQLILIVTANAVQFIVTSFYIHLFRERLSGKVHATILKGIVGGFEFSFFQRNLKELAQKPMKMCLRVLKESNKSRFDSYSRQEQCIDHIPYYLSGLSRVHFFPTTFLEIAVYKCQLRIVAEKCTVTVSWYRCFTLNILRSISPFIWV